MAELNKKYLDQSGVQEIVKKLANISANLSASDAKLQEFIENITALFYGDTEKGEFPTDAAPESKANPIIPALEGLIELVGEWDPNKGTSGWVEDVDADKTVIDVLKRVRDLVGTFTDEQNPENQTVIDYFQAAIDAEVKRAKEAEKALLDVLYNEEEGEEAFGGENKTVRGEIVKTRDYIAEKVFVGAEGLYKDGWLDIAFKNAKGEVIGTDQLTAGKALEGDVTMQFDFTRLTRDAFLKNAKQVEVITVADYINLANSTEETEGVKYTNLQAGKEIASKADSAVKIAYDVTDYKVFGIDNESVATEYGIEYKKLGETKLNHLYLVFVFELKSDDLDEQMTAMDTVWVDVANLIKHYAFYASGADLWKDEFDSDDMKDYQFDEFFVFDVEEKDREDDAQKKSITYTFKTTRKFSEYMKQIVDNKNDIQALKEFVGYGETDGESLLDKINNEVTRATAAEKAINDFIGKAGEEYDSFNEDIEATTLVGAINEIDNKIGDVVGGFEDYTDHEGNKPENLVDAIKNVDACVDALEDWVLENTIPATKADAESAGEIESVEKYLEDAFAALAIEDLLKDPA